LVKANDGISDSACRNAHYPPHRHDEMTTHLIRHGGLTIRYPDSNDPTRKESFGVGSRIDVGAGVLHEVRRTF